MQSLRRNKADENRPGGAGKRLIVVLQGRKDEVRTEVGREAGSFSTKLGLKVFKECQRGTRGIFFLRSPFTLSPFSTPIFTVAPYNPLSEHQAKGYSL